ncbi:DNA-binding LacI/PurR family transcriptional regulator [Saccharothrix ecbatanensis]|uniref:DNA-binding LacI/PurR family transcriptional regulator n=1 Tax=Saccharothrix ecbatanensis TaxID=1105145 RepID=A0A7W9HFP9_9PSEU|nr:LacI family DNA-binding transcriptional regulator [Saccharothrix ecbatanensis]MBB5801395.1 DNA-binding LacI/PurR family transcriptional regulator [Saccharothrix ecbatanensis]
MDSRLGGVAVTIKDVARLAGVSASSVCRTLAAPDDVRPDTRERVQRAVAELGYYPNRAARGLITGRTGNLGLIVPDIANPFFPDIIKAAEARARELDYAVFLADTDEDPAAEMGLIRAMSKQVDGFLLVSARCSDEELRSVYDDMPVVVVQRCVRHVPAVTFDDHDGIRQAVGHLATLGHRRVAYVAGPRTSWSNKERQRILRSTTSAAGIELVDTGHAAPTLDGGTAVADLVLATRATAVMAFNDMMALGLLRRFRALGVDVPGDISVVGFDDIPLAELVDPPLTTISLAKQRVGRAGVDMLIGLLDGRLDRAPRTILPTQLTVRASTGPARRD